ncbi:hypothetical protein PGT21_005816 [Puccinia graminis f. sp. tritici]|uniref:Uncharacterized protein n=1 Tax=Puccinia graminis f. sp. tritici TaxID=56615 RepID=A0A5B0Q1T5_PUCGR|nr:hypothetical protein PGT21_005816 [Puccinia graminis f. sp. tritici]
MYQPCHRCDRIRLAISVPSPLQIPLSVGILHDWPIRHLLSLLEFDLPPPNLDFDLLLSSEQVHAVVTVLHPPLALAAATFQCSQTVGRSDPSIDIGVCYYPDRDQWSPIFNPCVVPDDNADGNNSPIDPVDNQGPVDVKPIVEAKEKGPAEANVDPALINTILACSASLVYIPKGMEIVETRTHYFPLKDKWHTINDPSRHYDCTRYQSLACFPSLIHSSVSRGTSTTPSFLLDSPSETSSKNSDASSTYPLISNYINLNHQGVQKLLLDDNTPPTAV